MMTGTGGWPLSVFLTPDKKPFYEGTYFPSRPAHDLLAFNDILQAIVSNWYGNREQLLVSSKDITEFLQKSCLRKLHYGEVSFDLLDNFHEQLVLQFDRTKVDLVVMWLRGL